MDYKVQLNKILSISLVILLVLGSLPIAFSADSGLSASIKYISSSLLPSNITLTNTNNTFTPQNTYPMLVKAGVTTNLTIGSQAAGSITATLPSGLSNGTYEIRVGDPNGPNTTNGAKYFIVGNLVIADPTISSISPEPNLSLDYKDITDITVRGLYTKFATGQSTVEIINSNNTVVMTPTIKSVTTIDVNTKDLVFSLGTGLSEGSYKVRVTTGTEAITTSGAVITVRGQASVAYSGMNALTLNEGYSAQTITLVGTNTGFLTGSTTVQAVDEDNVVTSKVSSLNITNSTNLSFTLSTGLSAGTYTLKVKTNAEEAEIDFTVNPATASLYDSTGNNLITAIGRQGNNVTFRILGQNTSFVSGTSTFQLLKGSSVVTGGVISSTVGSVTTTDVTVNANQTPGTDYKLRVTTGSQVIETQAFEIKAQTTPAVTYSSIVYSDGKLSVGYPSFLVTVTGDNYSNFTSSSTATIGGNTPTITLVDNTSISFTFPTGLTAGSYSLSIDMDGNAGTTFDIFSYSLQITAPVIANISPSSIINTVSTAKTISVLGTNTHYALADAVITVKILDGSNQPVGSVSNITSNGNTGLKFDIVPNTITTTGKYTVNTKVVKGSYTEDLSLTEGLTVSSSGISTVTPSSIYKDALNNSSIAIVGIGTGFDDNDTYQIDNANVAKVVTDSTHVTLPVSNSITVGVHTIKIIDGASTYTSSFQILGERTISVNGFTAPIDYTTEIVTVTAENIDFLASVNNLPTITIEGSNPTPSTTVTSDSITFPLPTGLDKGNFTVSFAWTSGDHAGLSLSDTLSITNRYSSLYFKEGSNAVTTLSTNVGANKQLTVYGTLIAGGADENTTAKATYSIVNGSDVISLTASGEITALKKGTAIVRASYDEKTVDLSITVNRSLTEIFFKVGSVDVTSLAKVVSDTPVTLSVYGISSTNGAELEVTDETTLSITSGANVVSLEGTTITFLTGGTAVIHAVNGVLTADLNITVTPVYVPKVDDDEDNVIAYVSPIGTVVVEPITSDNLPVASIENSKVTTQKATLQFDNNAITFEIPEQSFNQGGEVKVEKLKISTLTNTPVIQLLNDEVINLVEKKENYSLNYVSEVYNFTSETIFTKPITVTFKFNPVKVTNLKYLGVYTYNVTTKQWDYVGGKVKPSTGEISTKLDHFSIYTVMEYSKSFPDIKKHWAKASIEDMAARHIATGVGEQFEPDRNITRAEFATLLVKALELDVSTTKGTFKDVISTDWYAAYVNTAATSGLVSGYNGSFSPNNKITRQEMAVMIAKAYELKKGKGTSTLTLKFTDQTKISDWATGSVKLTNSLGIINGYPDMTFKPSNNATRAEGIVMLKNLLNKIE